MMLYDFQDWTDSRTVQLRAFDPFEPPFEKALGEIREGWTCVDVGAAIGYYTIKMAQLVGPQGKVLAIEPHPEICSVLARNVRRYGLHNVTVVQKAVDRKKRKTRLYEAGSRGGTYTMPLMKKSRNPMTVARLQDWVYYVVHGRLGEMIRKGIAVRLDQASEKQRETLVDADRLDSLVPSNLRPVNIIKMDIQGMEFDALKGARRILRDKPILLIEVHPSSWWLRDSLLGLLWTYGYEFRLEEIDGRADVFLVTE